MLLGKDKAGNENTINSEMVKVSRLGVATTVTARPDDQDKGVELEVDSAGNQAYKVFAHERLKFNVNAQVVITGADKNSSQYVSKLETQFVKKGEPINEAANAWTSVKITGQEAQVSTDVELSGNYDGYLYVRAAMATGKEVTRGYRIMIENNIPIINTESITAKVGNGEQGNTEVNVPYETEKWYRQVDFTFAYGENLSKIPQSGIQSINVYRTDTGANINKELNIIQPTPDKEALGFMESKFSFSCALSGQYQLEVVLKDMAGNEFIHETDEIKIDQAVPEVKTEWKKPTGDHNQLKGQKYGFGVWSDQNPTIELSINNANTGKDWTNDKVQSQVTYYYKCKTEAVYADKTEVKTDWTIINETPVDPGEKVTFNPKSKGDYDYEFKAITTSNTAGVKAEKIKVDTEKPDSVLVVPSALPEGENGWYKNTAQNVTLSFKNVDKSEVIAHYETYWKQNDDGKADNGVLLDGKNPRTSGSDAPDYTGEFKTEQAPVIALNADGVYTLKVWTTDEAGNRIADKIYTYKVDTKLPKIVEIKHGDDVLGKWMEKLTFGLFKSKGDPLLIKTSDETSNVAQIEYVLGSTTIDEGAIPTEGWQIYNTEKPQRIDPNNIGSLFIRIKDTAGNQTDNTAENARMSNMVVDQDKPMMTVEPKEDLNKWQQSVTFHVEMQDAPAGIMAVEFIDDGGKPVTLSMDINGMFSEELKKQYRISNVTAEKNAETGLYTGDIAFDIQRNAPCINANTPHTFKITGIDSAGNRQESIDFSYRIDTAKPVVATERQIPNKDYQWYSVPAVFDLKNTKEAAVDGTPEQTAGKTLSKINYYYSEDARATWKKINGAPTYGALTYPYKTEGNNENYFKGVSESGVESDITDELVVMYDVQKPETPVTAIIPDTPDGQNGWYNKYPEIKITENKSNPNAAPESTFYKLYTEGTDPTTVQPAILGQSILNSFFQKNDSSPTAEWNDGNGKMMRSPGITTDQNAGKDQLSITGTAPTKPTVNGGEGSRDYIKPDEVSVSRDKMKKSINVLNIYPGSTADKAGNVGNLLQTYINDVKSGIPGELTINVKSMSINDFNGKSVDQVTSYLKKDGTNYYDIVYYGMIDAGGPDIDYNAYTALRTYLDAGYGFLVGHDTIGYWGADPATSTNPSQDNSHPNMNNLIDAEVQVKPFMPNGSNITRPNPGTFTQGFFPNDLTVATELQVPKGVDGDILNYPFKIDKTKPFTAAQSHSNRQMAHGKVWVEFVADPRDPSLVTAVDGVKGTNNFYLTTTNNIGMIQAGHA
ncbi:MAG: hypothetical protein RR614_00175, partial [Eubacterium sp.]